jgi:hypothetical protein
MSSSAPLRIGYVPEHYLLPLHLAKPNFPFPVELIPFPSGTGHMITSLRSDAIDLAIGLTEGWVAGLLTAEGQKARGYSVVGSWVQNPLRWAVVTGRSRDNIQSVADLKTHRRVGVSRMGSGSHIMAFVLAQQEGWFAETTAPESKKSLVLIPLGPFADLRNGVTCKDREAPLADFFMWEHFTTKPYFHGDETPLKKIGEIYTPWPSWHIAASSSTFSNPENDERLARIFETLDRGIEQFNATPEEAVRLLGTGDLGCHYTEEDAREWLKGAKFAKSTKGVDPDVMESVVKVLQGAGVVDSGTKIRDGDGVVGLAQ